MTKGISPSSDPAILEGFPASVMPGFGDQGRAQQFCLSGIEFLHGEGEVRHKGFHRAAPHPQSGDTDSAIPSFHASNGAPRSGRMHRARQGQWEKEKGKME